MRAATGLARCTSQMRAVPSSLAVTTRRLAGPKLAVPSARMWPTSVASAGVTSSVHSRTEPSALAVASR